MKPVKQVSVLIFLIHLTIISKAQQSEIRISGIIIDSVSLTPIKLATVRLIDGKKATLNTTTTDQKGEYHLVISSSVYQSLIITIVGYQEKYVDISRLQKKEGILNIKDIKLKASTTDLKEVTVNSSRPLIRQDIDRIIYDVQADPDSKSVSLFDIIRKVPLLSLTADDEVQMKGNSNFRVLLDGRQSSLFVRNPRDIFKSIPAANIDRIEVITVPPAKYDSEGLTGILNIVMKKSLSDGYNASVGASAGKLLSNINGSLNYRQSKFGATVFISGSSENAPETGFTKSLLGKEPVFSDLEQTGTSSFTGNSLYSTAYLSYAIDSLNLITSSFGFTPGSSKRINDQSTSIFDTNRNLLEGYQLANSKKAQDHGADITLNYQLGFKNKKNKLLTFSYRFMSYRNREDILNELLSGTTGTAIAPNQRNDYASSENTVQIDYVQPYRKINTEFGIKYIRRGSESISLFESYNTDQNNIDPNVSEMGNFDYSQQIYSAYNAYRYKLKKWGFGLGLRFEGTSLNGNLEISNQNFTQDYYNLLPTISMQRIFANNSNINLSFNQRVQRPGIRQLNPFVDKSNSRFYSTGNPMLEPVLNNNIEISYSYFKKISLSLNMSYSFARNTIQTISSYLIDTISISSYRNIGRNKNLNLYLNFSYPISQALTLTVSGSVTHVRLQGEIDGETLSNRGFQGLSYGYLSYKFLKDWRATANGGYYSPTIILQGKANDYFYSSLGLSRNFLKGAGNISANVTNPFQKLRMIETNTQTNSFALSSVNYNYFRNYSLSLSYRFGKLKKAVDKSKRAISNDDQVK